MRSIIKNMTGSKIVQVYVETLRRCSSTVADSLFTHTPVKALSVKRLLGLFFVYVKLILSNNSFIMSTIRIPYSINNS